MSSMGALDWGIVIAYLVAALAIGAWATRKASKSTENYFLAGRSLPWYIAGTSMVATTFAADTPLWVCGVVATRGIAGNWFWWSFAIVHVLAAVYLARLWRRSEVVTDAAIIEERYSGKEAATLRVFKAFFFAVPINCITMGWVILAMRKIMGVFVDWNVILPEGWFVAFEQAWPQWVAVDASTGLSVIVAMTLAVAYSTAGGLRGVVITDLLQFALAMIGSFAVAIYGVRRLGGLDGLIEKLEAATGDAAGVLAYVPDADSEWMPLHLFAMYLLVLWWAQKYSDAGGYLMQRMGACKDDRHAAAATLWFTVAHYVLRSWPWIIAGLVALVVYPAADYPGLDRETTYPMLMRDLLPTGLLGITVASLVAAFMSTIDTHVNWGASYLITDIYRRFIKRDADEKHYVKASRWAVILIAVIAAIIASQMNSIDAAWKFFAALGSGLGLVNLMRWVWWRVSAWSELTALISTSIVTLMLTALPAMVPLPFGIQVSIPFTATILITMGVSSAFWLMVTWNTPPTDPDVLDAFYRRVRPLGFWGPVRARCPDVEPREKGLVVLGAWAAGCGFIYCLLFGIGEVLLGTTWLGFVLVAIGLSLGALTYKLILAGDSLSGSPTHG